MLKKLFAFTLVFAMLLTMAACGSDERKDRNDRDERNGQGENDVFDFLKGDSDSDEDEENDTAKPAVSYADQIALIVSEMAQWAIPSDDYYQPYSYTVTDLDHNGRVELIVSVCMGTGFFSYNNVWEVNESFDGITLCRTPYGEYGSQSDIIVSQLKAYRDGEHCYYIVSDYVRSGWAWNGEEIRAYCLKDGAISDETLASYSCNNYEDGTSDTTYFDANGREISESEYENVASDIYSDLEELDVTLLWHTLSEEEFSQLDDESLTSLLTQAWQGFTVG